MVSRRDFVFRRRLRHISTAFTAFVLTVGLTGMRVSAVEIYTSEQNGSGSVSSIIKSLAKPDNQVTAYSLLEYAEFVPGPVDCSVETCIALTFDDGPDPATTPQILDALEKVHAQATFFVMGKKVGANIGLLKRMQTYGHEAGNHSWAHPDFTKLTAGQMSDEVAKTQTAIISAGLPAPRYFRPPYESRNELVRQTVNMPIILWNIDTKDWAQKSSDSIVLNAVSQARPGSIIIMHDVEPLTIQALPKILDQLKGQYHFVTISHLLNLPADAKGEYFSR